MLGGPSRSHPRLAYVALRTPLMPEKLPPINLWKLHEMDLSVDSDQNGWLAHPSIPIRGGDGLPDSVEHHRVILNPLGNMDCDLNAPVKRPEHLHQAIQRETTKICISNPRKVRCSKSGQVSSFSNGEHALVQTRDNAGSQNRLGLFQIRTGIAQVTKYLATSFHQFKIGLAHNITSRFNRATRLAIKSISAFGVLIPAFDFLRNAWTTQSRPAPSPSGFAISALPPFAAIVSAVFTRSLTASGNVSKTLRAALIQLIVLESLLNAYVVIFDYILQYLSAHS